MPSLLCAWKDPSAWHGRLLGGALVASWFDVAPFWLPGRAGLAWAAVFVCMAALNLAARCGARSLLARAGWVEAMAVIVAGSALVSALASGAALASIAEALRIGVVLLFLCLVRLSPNRERARFALGVGAMAVIIANALVLFFGLAFRGSMGAMLFEQQFQEVLGQLPRFKGFAAHPMAFAGPFLPLVAMGAWPFSGAERVRPWLAAAAVLVAGLTVAATASFAAVCLVVVFASVLCSRRMWRGLAMTAAAVLALLVLWCDPVEVSWAGSALVSRAPPPQYYAQGLGPRLMPVHALQLGSLRVAFRNRGYFYLLTGAVSCASERPVLGVGPKQFQNACHVLTMGTGGGWSSHRSAHTEYGALLAERGLLGVAATLALVIALSIQRRRWSGRPRSLRVRLDEGALLAHLVAAFAGPIWYQLAFAALVGVWSRPPKGGDAQHAG